jgi:hypothetical protein
VRLGATGTVRCIALVCGSGVSREGLRSDPFCEGPAKVSRWSAPSRLASLPQGRAGAPAEDLPMRH